jgi:hypothetical protein
MNVRVALAFAAMCVPALTGCGSVTNDINFQAPGAGWTASPSILGRTQIWVKSGTGGNAHNSIVVLVRGVGTGSTRQLLTGQTFGTNGQADVVKDEQTTICSGQPAEHVMATGRYTTAASSGRASLDVYLSTVKGERYLAMYVRPEDQPADPTAETAIRSLCPKPA